MFESEYAYWPFVISQLTLMGGAAFLFVVGIVVFLHAFFYAKSLGVCHIRLFGIILLCIIGLSTVALSVSQGMDQIHTAGSVVIAVLLWTIFGPVVFVFLGGNAELVLWLKSNNMEDVEKEAGGTTKAGAAAPSSVPVVGTPSAGGDSCGISGSISTINSNKCPSSPSSSTSLRRKHPEFYDTSCAGHSGIDGVKGPGMKRIGSPRSGSLFEDASSASASTATSNIAILRAKAELAARREEERRRRQGEGGGDDDYDDSAAVEMTPKRLLSPGGTREPIGPASADVLITTEVVSPSGGEARRDSPNTSLAAVPYNNVRFSAEGKMLVEGDEGYDEATAAGAEVDNDDEHSRQITAHAISMLATTTSGGDGGGFPMHLAPQKKQAGKASNSNSSSNNTSHREENNKDDTSIDVITGDSNTNSASSPSSPTSCCNVTVRILKNFLLLVKDDITRRPLVFALSVLFAVSGILLSNLLLYGICVMNKPQSINTWLIRRHKERFCPVNGKPCFVYPLVGDVCSSMVLASHFVIDSDEQIPVHTSATVCEVDPVTNTKIAASCTTVSGILRNKDDIQEDRRYIANIYIQGLKCGFKYTARVRFSSSSSSSSTNAGHFDSDEICFLALPGASANPGGGGGEELTFIEGGDYVVKGRSSKPSKGKTVMKQAVLDVPEAAFFAIGGDLSYENNMRRCYRRVDEFLFELLDVLKRPADQCLIPLLTTVGNHDSGGYLWQNTQLATVAGRSQASSFYLQYYPFLSYVSSNSQQQSATQPTNGTSGNFSIVQGAPSDVVGDFTSTFHVHLLGSNSSFIVVDSGLWSPLETQAQLLKNALQEMRSQRRTATISYHVPMFPSTRVYEDPSQGEGLRSQQVRGAFSHVIAQYDDVVTLVFEHHDHNYKRTFRISPVNGSVVISSSGSSGNNNDNNDPYSENILARKQGRGVVFNGDGALGASDFSKLSLASPPLAVGESGNYVSTVRMFGNGSMVVKAIAPDGRRIDHFVVV